MKRFTLVVLDSKQCFFGTELGVQPGTFGRAWIGTTGEPFRTYSFWERGSFGTFRLPETLQIGDEFHVGIKGDSPESRIKWKVEDFDEKYLLVRPLLQSWEGNQDAAQK